MEAVLRSLDYNQQAGDVKAEVRVSGDNIKVPVSTGSILLRERKPGE